MLSKRGEKLFFNSFIGVELIYNIVLVSVYSEVSQLHIHIYPLLFFGFFPHIGHYRAFSRVPCARQQFLFSFLFYLGQCVYVNPNLLVYLSLQGTF